jgi:hypothetical protein
MQPNDHIHALLFNDEAEQLASVELKLIPMAFSAGQLCADFPSQFKMTHTVGASWLCFKNADR